MTRPRSRSSSATSLRNRPWLPAFARPLDRMGDLFDEYLPQIAKRLSDLGGEPVGAPYGRYHAYGPQGVDVEIGVPVAAPVPNLRSIDEAEPGEVSAAELPGGRVAVTVHRGAYRDLMTTYRRLEAWLEARGHRPGARPWESYVDDPADTNDVADVRTEVVWPLG